MIVRANRDWDLPVLRRRAMIFAIALLIEALLIVLLLTMGRERSLSTPMDASLSAFNLPLPGAPKQAARKAEHKQVQPQKQAPRQEIPPTHLPAPNPVKLPPVSHGYIPMSHDDFAENDLANFAHQGSGSGGAGAVIGPGEGPGGAPMYNAEWVREPTDAELAPYLETVHHREPGNWAMIACKTIDHYHVENCVQLGESNPGSGLARSLRLAAWQFLVRPPRIGNKPQLGVWVRIRFDFGKRAGDAKEDASAG